MNPDDEPIFLTGSHGLVGIIINTHKPGLTPDILPSILVITP